MYIFIPFCILTEYVFNLDGFFAFIKNKEKDKNKENKKNKS